MLPEINMKETVFTHPVSKEPIAMQNSNQSHLPSCDNGYSNFNDVSHVQDFKFYFIKSTEESKTGFPILPAALNPHSYKGANISDTVKPSCKIPLRTLPHNSESILVPGIRSFLKKCYNYADKRRRSSRVCKHKPGVKHYCRRKNWTKILSKYKAEVLDNSLVDLGTFYKTSFLNSNKEILHDKQNGTQNKAQEPLVLTSIKEHTPQQIESSNKVTDPIIKYSDSDIISQDGSCTSSDANSEYLGSTNCNEMDDMSTFLAIFGLRRKVLQKEVVSSDDLKLVTAETSNNEEAEVTANLDETSGGIDAETSTIGVVEETTNNKISSDMNSVPDNFEDGENCEEQKEDCESVTSNMENVEQCQERNDENDTFSEQNSEDLDTNAAQYGSVDSNKESTPEDTLEDSTSSASQGCLCHSERLPCHLNPMNEACVSLHSSVDVNNFFVDNLLRNGSWSMTACPPGHSSVSVKCETRGLLSNNHEQETNNIGNHITPNFQGPHPVHHGSQTCTPRHMYSQTGGINGVFPNFYGSPCVPTPVLASQLVPPILVSNFLPMNNIMCAAHPGLMPFPSNGAYLSTFDCTSQHHSMPYHSTPNSSPNLYHKPGFHQWVNVNASAVVPCWTQSTYIGGAHLPCCGGSSHSLEARSQLHFSSGYYPTDG